MAELKAEIERLTDEVGAYAMALEQCRHHTPAQCAQGPVWSASKHDEIIKRLMADIGYPNSQSVYGAFKQFANELHALSLTSTDGGGK